MRHVGTGMGRHGKSRPSTPTRQQIIDAAGASAHLAALPDGWTTAAGLRPGGGKSGLHGNTVPANCRRGRPQGKCHRKQTARTGTPSGKPLRARVKRCGKSAPRFWQQRRQGKPHREQDRIGAAGGCASRTQGYFRPVARVGRVRRAAMRVPEEWSSRAPARTEPGLQTVWQIYLQRS